MRVNPYCDERWLAEASYFGYNREKSSLTIIECDVWYNNKKHVRSNQLAGHTRLRGVFTIDEEYAYDNHPILFGQFTPDSCVAACCKMLLEDEERTETEIRIAVKVIKDEGAYIKDAPEVLKRFDSSLNYTYKKKLSIDELRAATEKGPAMISIQTPITGSNYHAVIVDRLEQDMVLIRDPLPRGMGSAYKITLLRFTKAWTGKAVILDP